MPATNVNPSAPGSAAKPSPSPKSVTPPIRAAVPGATDPALAMLERLDARLARMEARMDRLGEVADQVPGLAEMGLDVFDEAARRYDLDARSQAAVTLLERVSRADTLERLTQVVELLDALPGQVELALDTVDELAADAEAKGVDLSRLVPEGTALLTKFIVAHQAAMASPGEQMGLFGLLRAAREPELRRALAFLVTLGRSLGDQLQPSEGRPALPESR